MTETSIAARRDREAGVLLAAAAGDALGAGYEFTHPGPSDRIAIVGGGTFGWEPGEWTDDTQMALVIAQVAAGGLDLTTEAARTAVARGFQGWYAADQKDVGTQTRKVLAGLGPDVTAEDMTRRADELHERTGHTAGNGSLMRTGAIALALLDDPDRLVEAATRMSGLTHADPRAGQACALWCLGIRHAVLHGTFEGVREGLRWFDDEAAGFWAARLDEAEQGRPADFNNNGWVVHALQTAWWAITTTPVPAQRPAGGSFACQHLQEALVRAVRAGGDTDTVAAIAGQLLGARWGASAVPASWRRLLHGWPGYRDQDLVRVGLLAAAHGRGAGTAWPDVPTVDYSQWRTDTLVRHPDDSGLWLSGAGAAGNPPPGVDLVVSLCRMGTSQVPDRVEHVTVWLVDTDDGDNPNLDFVIDDTARLLVAARDDGRTVLLHCVEAASRTPTVAARYAQLRDAGADAGPDAGPDALARVLAALPSADPVPGMRTALDRLAGARPRPRSRRQPSQPGWEDRDG